MLTSTNNQKILDVNLWHGIGALATERGQLPLARLALERGIAGNPDHWPCLRKLAAVLYGMDDLAACRELGAGLLQRTPSSKLGQLLLLLAAGKAPPGR